MKKIILVGCGNIGSRHLQAIVKLKNAISVEIVEPSVKEQRLEKSRLNKIKYNKTAHKLFWYK
jgi:pyrroline-5-carboxylate reductase